MPVITPKGDESLWAKKRLNLAQAGVNVPTGRLRELVEIQPNLYCVLQTCQAACRRSKSFYKDEQRGKTIKIMSLFGAGIAWPNEVTTNY